MAQGGLPNGVNPEDPEARRVKNVYRSFDSLKLHFVLIRINSASHLKAADHSLKGASSDPFIIVKANDQTFTTKTIEKNLNPVFNEETTFCFFDLIKELKFEVFDWDKGSKHDSIGTCTLDTSNFFNANNNGFSGDIKLQNVKTGSINVNVRGKLIVPKELQDRCANLENLKSQQQSEIDNLTMQFKALETKEKELTSKRNALNDELQGLTVNKETLSMEEYQVKQKCGELRQKVENVKQEIDQIVKEQESCQTKIANMKDEMNDNGDELQRQKSKRDSTLEKMQDLRQKMLQ